MILEYEDKVAPLDWSYFVTSERSSNFSRFPQAKSSVAPERTGLWGESTLHMDKQGVNWLEVSLNAAWDLKWESTFAYNKQYVGLAWSMLDTDSLDKATADTFTTLPGETWEVAIQGGKRNPKDTVRATTPALDFMDLV